MPDAWVLVEVVAGDDEHEARSGFEEGAVRHDLDVDGHDLVGQQRPVLRLVVDGPVGGGGLRSSARRETRIHPWATNPFS